jgi:redox-sensitive bicupin YhaK (pirin superfamily)
MNSSDTSIQITHRTKGRNHGGPITRLMSPSDLGQILKPFVFLDLIDADAATIPMFGDMPLHPHSGIATVTVFSEGVMHFHDAVSGTGTLAYGGVEWMRAGGGVWHGKEMSVADDSRLRGFQLWIALPPELENGAPESRYFEASRMHPAGPAYVVIGEYEGVQSPVPAPQGINYLLVTLAKGQRWTYRPPAGHSVAWLAAASGALVGDVQAEAGEMVIFESGNAPISLEASTSDDAVFVIGSALPHPHPLHLGYYSVHTSAEALDAGERRIAELKRRLDEAGHRQTASGTIPVFR